MDFNPVASTSSHELKKADRLSMSASKVSIALIQGVRSSWRGASISTSRTVAPGTGRPSRSRMRPSIGTSSLTKP